MKGLKIAGAGVAVLGIIIVCFLAYLGFFSTVSVTEKESEKMVIMYEPFTGPYAKTMDTFERVRGLMKKEGLDTRVGAGVYYDNPDLVPAEKLRSECGFIIQEKDSGRIEALKKRYTFRTIEKGSFLYAEFPVKNFFSYIIGPMKVYPVFSKTFKQKGVAPSFSIEVYDAAAGVIRYYMPVTKK